MFAPAFGSGSKAAGALLAAVGVLAGTVAGAAAARSTTYGLALAIVVLTGVALVIRPVLFGVVAMVGVYASYRLGGAALGGGVSYSDALLAAATFFALPSLLGAAELRRLWLALSAVGAYLVCLLPTIFVNPSHRAYLEWAHRFVLVGGSLVVGAWIVQQTAVRLALRALVAISCLVSIASMIDTVRRGLGPAAPFGLNKNLAGALLGLVVVVLVVVPNELEFSRRARVSSVVVVMLGLLATQSRGGMLAAATGLLLAFVLDWRAHSRNSRLMATLAALVFVVFVSVSVHDELQQTTQELNNSSIGVRRNVERVTREIWHTSPVVGVGLKYFNNPVYGEFAQAANNVIDNELAESGVIGLGGFLLLQVGVLWAGVRRRRRDPLMIAAIGCVSGELVHGMVDIYWSAGVVTLPFLILGLALGRPAAQEAGKISSSTRESTALSS